MITTSHVARRRFLSGAAASVAITCSTHLGSGCAQIFRRHPKVPCEQLATDATAAAGQPAGEHRLGEVTVRLGDTGRV
jgi:N-acetylglucosamine-6-phosphate deacetylase